jgi:hypothetical protein
VTMTEVANGELEFMLTFTSKDTPFKVWNEPQRVKKYAAFFGGTDDDGARRKVWSEVRKIDGPNRVVAIAITTGDDPRPAPDAAPVAAE